MAKKKITSWTDKIEFYDNYSKYIVKNRLSKEEEEREFNSYLVTRNNTITVTLSECKSDVLKSKIFDSMSELFVELEKMDIKNAKIRRKMKSAETAFLKLSETIL